MVFFIFKQKTAYDMRISDWSSDVCSSDLHFARTAGNRGEAEHRDVHRHQEIVERGIVIASAKLALVRKADRVDDEVDAGPVAREIVERAIAFRRVGNVAEIGRGS